MWFLTTPRLRLSTEAVGGVTDKVDVLVEDRRAKCLGFSAIIRDAAGRKRSASRPVVDDSRICPIADGRCGAGAAGIGLGGESTQDLASFDYAQSQQRAAEQQLCGGLRSFVCQVVQPKGANVNAVIIWINTVIECNRRYGYGRAGVHECALRIEPVRQLPRGGSTE